MDYLNGLPMDYPKWTTLKFAANINLTKLQWATKVLRHFVIFEYLRQISFLISTILPTPPFSMLNFLSLEFASFLYNIEKGGGGLALNINRI